jgi:hypothetical protein
MMVTFFPLLGRVGYVLELCDFWVLFDNKLPCIITIHNFFAQTSVESPTKGGGFYHNVSDTNMTFSMFYWPEIW